MATPIPVLGLLLPLLLLVVDLQQVLLHAGGDLWAQVPDEHAAAEARDAEGEESEHGSYYHV
jgi:hypothetical protein